MLTALLIAATLAGGVPAQPDSLPGHPGAVLRAEALDDTAATAAELDGGTPSPPPDSTDWRAHGTLAFTDVSGNKTLTLLSVATEVSRRGGHALEMTFSAGARYGRSDGVTAVEDFSGGAEFRFLPSSDLSPFLTATAMRDDVKNVQIRLAASAGAAANVVNDSLTRVSLGLAVLQDYERDRARPWAIITSRTRMSASLDGIIPIRSGVQLEHKTRFEPVATHFGDYLFTSQTAIRVLLSQHFALQTTWQFQRDTTPPEGVLFRNDRTLTVGLTVQTD